MALPFFGIGMKLTFSSPVATPAFSKFAGMLSAALSQHRLLRLQIAQLEFVAICSDACGDVICSDAS